MTDLLIRNVDAEVVARIEARAKAKGLARAEFLRRELAALGSNAESTPLTREELARSLAAMPDLGNAALMARAWS